MAPDPNGAPQPAPAPEDPPAGAPSPSAADTTTPSAPQAAPIGGNVGPVGSSQEKNQLGFITGARANAATELLLGPLVRGSTVQLTAAKGQHR
jgi:hypothetical protein